MGDHASDPIDHHRTTPPLAGETMKNTAKAPGLVFVAVAAAAFVIYLGSFAVRQVGVGLAPRSSPCLPPVLRWPG